LNSCSAFLLLLLLYLVLYGKKKTQCLGFGRVCVTSPWLGWDDGDIGGRRPEKERQQKKSDIREEKINAFGKWARPTEMLLLVLDLKIIPPPITGGLWSTGKGCAMCDYGCDDNYGG